MLVDEQSELMNDLLFTVHQHGGDDERENHLMRKCSYFRANKCIFALLVAVSRQWLRIFS